MKFNTLFICLLFTLSGMAQNYPVPAHKNGDIMQPMGYIDAKTNKWVIPPIFDYAKEFGPQGSAVIYRNGKAGFVDLKGVVFISPTFDDAQNFNEDGVAIVRQAGKNDRVDGHMPSNDRFGAIDMTGRLIIPYVFRELNDHSFRGTLIGKQEYKWGIISTKGKVILPFRYTMINVHGSKEVAIVRHDSTVGVLRNEKDSFYFIVPPGDNMARFAGSKMISLYKDGKYGYCNFKGELKIPYEFNQFSIFRGGLCIVKRNGYYGFIDTLGKTVVPFEYDGGEAFVNDTAIMIKQGKMGLINSKNEVLVPFNYEKISRYYFPRPPGGLVFIKQGTWFFMDPKTHEMKMWEIVDTNDPNINTQDKTPKKKPEQEAEGEEDK